MHYFSLIYVITVPFWMAVIDNNWKVSEKNNHEILLWLKNSMQYLSFFYLGTMSKAIYNDFISENIGRRIPEIVKSRVQKLYEVFLITGSFFVGIQSFIGFIKYCYMERPKEVILKYLCLMQIIMLGINGIALWIFVLCLVLVVILCCLLCFGNRDSLENPLEGGILSNLQDNLQGVNQNKMTAEDAEKLQKFKTKLDESSQNDQLKKDQINCSICIKEYCTEEELLILPICKHNFHYDCVISWFTQKFECPMCRSKVKDQQSAEPQSELNNSTNIEVLECDDDVNINEETMDTTQDRFQDEEEENYTVRSL